ncbi:zinc-binding dehydrogenase [Hydrogenophaga sp. YM1]|nr:zinc-binding dehydrogenase [Hydrogenophaga sp. YM1]
MARTNLQHLFQLWGQGVISPKVTATYDFSQVPEAIEQLESRAALGKVVVKIDHDA